MIRRHPALFLFTLAYLALAGVMAARAGNSEFIFYGLVLLAIIGMVLWADREARFSGFVLWGLSIWGLLHLAGGTVPIPTSDGSHAVLYDWWIIPPSTLKFDNVVHAFGFFVTTLACSQVLRRFLDPAARPTLALPVLTCMMGMGFGAMNEVIEFLATRLFPHTNVGDYVNNALDLCWNFAGCLLATIIVWVGQFQRGSVKTAPM
ncbi:MAG TPA: DUF2238 domain-containing protein [Phycisphaerales bacterium]|nr:DUF2238 domain-containing protein [Phycisphaerales bacterium]